MAKNWREIPDDGLADEAERGLTGQGALVEAMRRLKVAGEKDSRLMLWLTVIIGLMTLVQVLALGPSIVDWWLHKLFG